MPKLDKKFTKFAEWYYTGEAERIQQDLPLTEKDFAFQHKIKNLITLRKWAKSLRETKEVDEGEQVARWRAKLFKDAMKPTATAKMMELFGKVHGQITDKSEMKVKIGFTADELIGIEREAREQNTNEGFIIGEGEVQREHPLLPYKVREDKGQNKGDNPMATLEASPVSD